MASVSPYFLLCILILSIISVETASPHFSVDHVAVTEDLSRLHSTSLAPKHLANSPHTKRAFPYVGPWGENYALPHGWSVTVSTLSVYLDMGSQAAAASWFDNFFFKLQTACAARMLNNAPYHRLITASESTWRFVIGMHPDSTVQQIEWSFVYYLAMYMRNWIRNGYTGTGAIMFKHTSGIKLLAFLVNDPGNT